MLIRAKIAGVYRCPTLDLHAEFTYEAISTQVKQHGLYAELGLQCSAMESRVAALGFCNAGQEVVVSSERTMSMVLKDTAGTVLVYLELVLSD